MVPLVRHAVALGLLVVLVGAAPTASGDDFPDFSLPVTDGTTFRLADHSEDVVVLIFMYPGLASYEVLEPSLKTLYREYRNGSMGDHLVMLSISVNPAYTLAELETYRQERGVPWLHARDDPVNSTATLYRVNEVVHIAIRGPSNVTRSWAVNGPVDVSGVTELVDSVIARAYWGNSVALGGVRSDPLQPRPGERVALTVPVTNRKVATAEEVELFLLIDHEAFPSRNVSVGPGETVEVAFLWNATEGDHELWAQTRSGGGALNFGSLVVADAPPAPGPYLLPLLVGAMAAVAASAVILFVRRRRK